MMRIVILGQSHLAESLRRAARMRGFIVEDTVVQSAAWVPPDLTFVAWDILDHADLGVEHGAELEFSLRRDLEDFGDALILVSQVPPGTTRRWARGHPRVYCQVDTIIMRHALARARSPEQFIVGCLDPEAPLPLAYQEYLMRHGDCPVRQMSYESAEVAKLAINYTLSKQIEAANDIAAVAMAFGADYADVERAMRGDARIGPDAYVRPGKTNRHLDRDIETIQAILSPIWSRGSSVQAGEE